MELQKLSLIALVVFSTILNVQCYADSTGVFRNDENGNERDLILETNEALGLDLFEGDIKGFHPRHRAAFSNPNAKWRNSTVPYVIDDSVDPEVRMDIKDAIEEFHKSTCVRWVPRTDHRDYVVFNKVTGCYSFVGNGGGAQEVSLMGPCARKGNIMHEMMHALGFFHEHSRPDRDDWVQILLENVQEGKEGNFDRLPESMVNTQGIEYDYYSIMHYARNAFSSNGEPTMLPKRDPDAQLGQREGFSPKDITRINRLYGCEWIMQSTTPSALITTTATTTTTTLRLTTTTTTTPRPTTTTTTTPRSTITTTSRPTRDRTTTTPRFATTTTTTTSRPATATTTTQPRPTPTTTTTPRSSTTATTTTPRSTTRTTTARPITSTKTPRSTTVTTTMTTPRPTTTATTQRLTKTTTRPTTPRTTATTATSPTTTTTTSTARFTTTTTIFRQPITLQSHPTNAGATDSPVVTRDPVGWGSWGDLTGCEGKCHHFRYRHCLNPDPRFCRGSKLDYAACPSPCQTSSACGVSYHMASPGSYGYIHVGNYDNHMTCEYVIQSGNPDVTISVNVTRMDIEESTDCTHDSLTFFDGANATEGHAMGTYCGYGQPSLQSSGNVLLVRFNSDSSTTGTGYTILFIINGNRNATSQPVFRCSFEGELCGFHHDPDDRWRWLLIKGNNSNSLLQDPSEVDPPVFTEGHFLYVESGTHWETFDSARISSNTIPRQNITDINCLTFRYRLHGNDQVHLQVLQQDDTAREAIMWAAKGDNPNQWQEAKVNLLSQPLLKITFEAFLGQQLASSAAVDDVTITTGRC